MKKKVFFSCSMQGGRLYLEDYKQIMNLIESLGLSLLTKHQIADEKTLSDMKFRLTPKGIYEFDLNCMREADFIIAEISNPSLGVGAEITDAIHLNKPVLCIFRKEVEGSLSNYVRGNPKLEFFGYQNMEELKEKILNFSNKVNTSANLS